MQGFAGDGFLDFGAELVYDFLVIRVKTALNHNESVGVRLTKQIFRLVNLVCRVYGNENRTDFSRSPERNVPRREVGCPDGNL